MTTRRVLDHVVTRLLVCAVCAVAWALGLGVVQAADPPCDWSYGQAHKMHWAQWPDYSALGVDVEAVSTTLADDFLCTATGPIRDIHLWCSFAGDTNLALLGDGPPLMEIELSIHSDVPAQGTAPSHPGQLLWTRTFGPGQYWATATHDGFQGWWDPSSGVYRADDHRKGFQLDFCIADRPFVQEEGTVYWLAVKASPLSSMQPAPGLKTALIRFQWNDPAVRLDGTHWVPMDYPKGHVDEGQALDLAFVITGGDDVRPLRDLGDAPDSSNSLPGRPMIAYPDTSTAASFPTVYRIGSPPYGPLHQSPMDCVFLGQRVSLEQEADLGFDEDPTTNLDVPGDRADLDSGDDGVVLPLVLPHCNKATLDYNVTVTDLLMRSVYVNVWFDWNRDGDWDDVVICTDGTQVQEWAVQNQQVDLTGVGTSTHTTPQFYCWHASPDKPQPLWMRITIAERSWTQSTILAVGMGGSGPSDGYQYGETEDYFLYPKAVAGRTEYDWGDAPDAMGLPVSEYPTLRSSNGPYHVAAGPWFGDANDQPDAEQDGQPDANALGDDRHPISALGLANDDEDGVSVPPLVVGQTVDITLEVRGGGGIVQGWVDFDADGDWESTEEVMNTFLPNGVHNQAVQVPNTAVAGWTFARFRIDRTGGLTPEGQADDGEVEDYKVWIWRLPDDTKWVQLPDTSPWGIDVCVDSNDGTIRHIADDFECTRSGPITQITLWGSWKQDKAGKIRTIHVEIHPDDPVGSAGSDSGNRFSKPGPEVLWSMDFGAGQFFAKRYHQTYAPGEWWQDKVAEEQKAGGDAQIWQIDLPVDPNKAFVQTGSESAPVIYWMHVRVDTEVGRFGWKTRRWPDHFMDDAVWDGGSELPRLWKELRYERPHPYYGLDKDSLDMAFLVVSPGSSVVQTCQPVCITTCPPVDTTCPAVLTQCPPVETQCPVASTQCPTTVTRCPAVDTQCPMQSTQCPVVETQCPSGPTYCPPVETQCPAIYTKCPDSQTKCPPVDTLCPPQETACPLVDTQCPPWETRCPPIETKCPSGQTYCPPVETRCPVVDTQCPTEETRCPPIETKCPEDATSCPPRETYCPPVQTQCPTQATVCPTQATVCPTVPTPTQCPIEYTQCPPTPTQCPTQATVCPTQATVCPTVPTPTQCPLVDTQCPSGQTSCPPVETRCPAVDTQCPQVDTLCPAMCPAAIGPGTPPVTIAPTRIVQIASGQPARIVRVVQVCPVVEADCLSLSD